MTDYTKHVAVKSLSPPFRFIYLPWVLVFIVIFFWFSFVPPAFSYYINHFNPSKASRCFFLLIQFFIFIVILCVLVYIWRRHPGKDDRHCKLTKQQYCSVSRSEKDLESCEDCFDVPEVAEKRPMLTIDLNSPDPKEVCIRSRPAYDDQRPLSQNLEVALTPRELFFRDLYESVFETDSTITRDFIIKEREFCSQDIAFGRGSLTTAVSWEIRSKTSLSSANPSSVSETPTKRKYSSTTAETKLDGEEQVAEFFVANVTHKQSVTSEVFLYVCDETDRSGRSVKKVVGGHSGDDDVFLK